MIYLLENWNAFLSEPIPARASERNGLGGVALLSSRLPLHHGAERRGGRDRAAHQLVLWRGGDRLAQSFEVWTELPGQSRRSRWDERASAQQARHTDDGRGAYRPGDGPFGAALGAAQRTG